MLSINPRFTYLLKYFTDHDVKPRKRFVHMPVHLLGTLFQTFFNAAHTPCLFSSAI